MTSEAQQRQDQHQPRRQTYKIFNIISFTLLDFYPALSPGPNLAILSNRLSHSLKDPFSRRLLYGERRTSAKLTEGSPVRLADREPNAADSKSGLYFTPIIVTLTGVIAKLYADETATVMIDPESLPSEIRARHQAGTDAMRQKWLDGLSDEARNKLSAAEKKFALRYNLLVGLADLSPGEALA